MLRAAPAVNQTEPVNVGFVTNPAAFNASASMSFRTSTGIPPSGSDDGENNFEEILCLPVSQFNTNEVGGYPGSTGIAVIVYMVATLWWGGCP